MDVGCAPRDGPARFSFSLSMQRLLEMRRVVHSPKGACSSDHTGVACGIYHPRAFNSSPSRAQFPLRKTAEYLNNVLNVLDVDASEEWSTALKLLNAPLPEYVIICFHCIV